MQVLNWNELQLYDNPKHDKANNKPHLKTNKRGEKAILKLKTRLEKRYNKLRRSIVIVRLQIYFF